MTPYRSDRSINLAPAGRSSAHVNRITDWSLDRSQRRLLTTSLDREATVWDLERDEAWSTFSGHGAPVLAGALSPDGL